MHEIKTPKSWVKVSGYVRWPLCEDFNEDHWNAYLDIVKGQNIEDKTRLHYGFETAALFTIACGEYQLTVDGDPLDLQEWVDKKEGHRIAVMSWMEKRFSKYISGVFDPNE